MNKIYSPTKKECLIRYLFIYFLLNQNELGDTFLHFPVAFEEQLTIEIALQKQPKLAHILNKESRSVMLFWQEII